jgi:hypothetical protein
MLLVEAIAVLGAVVGAGIWLGGRYILAETPPTGLRWAGAAHGVGGLAGLALLAAALLHSQPTPHAVKMGAGAFALIAAALLLAALGAGAVLLLAHLRGRPITLALVATHGLLAIAGYTLLVTYLTMLY